MSSSTHPVNDSFFRQELLPQMQDLKDAIVQVNKELGDLQDGKAELLEKEMEAVAVTKAIVSQVAKLVAGVASLVDELDRARA